MIFNKKTIIITYLIIGLLLLASFFLSYLVYSNNYDHLSVILHYSPSGVDFLGSSFQIFYLPAIGSFFILLNILLSIYLRKKDSFLCQNFLWVNVLISLMIFMIVFRYFLINR
ncbi:MAG: hypothetical protein NTW73_01910 [Candidatus Parcubacteria bacterium]|nr:hypothetical protein [Candidatus Parcubacteria bacterium]